MKSSEYVFSFFFFFLNLLVYNLTLLELKWIEVNEFNKWAVIAHLSNSFTSIYSVCSSHYYHLWILTLIHAHFEDSEYLVERCICS